MQQEDPRAEIFHPSAVSSLPAAPSNNLSDLLQSVALERGRGRKQDKGDHVQLQDAT